MIRANCYKKQAIRSKNKFDVNFPPFIPKKWIDHVDLHSLIFFMIDSTFQSFDHKNSDSIKKPMIEFLTLSSTNNMLHNQRMLQEQGQTESIHIRCSNICTVSCQGTHKPMTTHDYCTVRSSSRAYESSHQAKQHTTRKPFFLQRLKNSCLNNSSKQTLQTSQQ